MKVRQPRIPFNRNSLSVLYVLSVAHVRTSTKHEPSCTNSGNASSHYVHIVRVKSLVYIVPSNARRNVHRVGLRVVNNLIEARHGDEDVRCGTETLVRRVAPTFHLCWYESERSFSGFEYLHSRQKERQSSRGLLSRREKLWN